MIAGHFSRYSITDRITNGSSSSSSQTSSLCRQIKAPTSTIIRQQQLLEASQLRHTVEMASLQFRVTCS